MLGTLGLGFSITNSWLSYASCFGQSMVYGGPQATVFGLIVACFVQWAVAAGMAEQASAFPSSGGQYHFTFILAPEKHKKFAAFSVGLLSVIGWWVITCSGLSNNVQSIMGMAQFMYPDFEPQRWQSYLLYLGLLLSTHQLVIPIFTIPQRHIGKWTTTCLLLSILGFIIVTVVILAMCKSFQPASHLLEFRGASGWPDGMAWFMSIGNAMYAFASLDAVVHIAEEMHHPGKEIPRVILEAFHQATESKAAALGLQILLTVLFYTCMPSQWITCGRLAWAFARDNGLPYSDYWTGIHSYYEFPVRTTLLSAAFCAIYGLLYVASTQAFNSIITAAVLVINISYIVPQAICLIQGRAKKLPSRPFNLGILGYVCNSFSPVWITVIGIVICFPNILPVTAASMNYVCVVLGAISIFVVGTWYWIRNQFEGPQIDWDLLDGSNAVNS
ncbi:amino acid transporter [Colletotrichum truncatum]|uniref:Amino acid transporter n=1 Tax=Colletotrichum truncatum TaxID=5467 RepID=A0ACC3Z3G7_COLTU|nr:amino acid transporter [Colletotrichum truncatum]XP_036585429.1 amino acid transporter [Colletotrichum truncatum]KAF6780684.1 amino acid transporter [Colletotrichum truncatum]KAF6795480.1 amino acid transporter [Colletotrichum truncatum]